MKCGIYNPPREFTNALPPFWNSDWCAMGQGWLNEAWSVLDFMRGDRFFVELDLLVTDVSFLFYNIVSTLKVFLKTKITSLWLSRTMKT